MTRRRAFGALVAEKMLPRQRWPLQGNARMKSTFNYAALVQQQHTEKTILVMGFFLLLFRILRHYAASAKARDVTTLDWNQVTIKFFVLFFPDVCFFFLL